MKLAEQITKKLSEATTKAEKAVDWAEKTGNDALLEFTSQYAVPADDIELEDLVDMIFSFAQKNKNGMWFVDGDMLWLIHDESVFLQGVRKIAKEQGLTPKF